MRARVLKVDSSQGRGIGTRGGSGRDMKRALLVSLTSLLMTALQVLQSNKALPPPVKDNLPPTPPPQDHPHSFSTSAPLLPPKFNHPSPHSNGLRLPPPPIDIAASDDLLDQGGFLCSFSTPSSHLVRYNQTSTSALALPPARPAPIHAPSAQTH